jgi:hypothetical protein
MRPKILTSDGMLVDPPRYFGHPDAVVHSMAHELRPTVADFLRVIHPDDSGFLELRALAGRGTNPAPTFVPLPLTADGLRAVQAYAAKWGHNSNIYHGIATRAHDMNGKRENCSKLWAVYIDNDLKAGVPMQTLLRSLRDFPLKPSFLVHSGGGLHPYWALSEPIDLTTPLGLERAGYWLKKLAHLLNGDLKVAEPARILRMPDTFNHKPEYVRPLVTILSASGTTYTLADVIAVLGDADPNKTAEPFEPDTHAVDLGLDSDTRVGLAMGWLKQQRPAVEGDGGDQHTYNICCSVTRGHDLDEPDALRALHDWNARCLPPWDDSALKQKIRSAIRCAMGPAGSKLLARDRKKKAIAKSQHNVRVALAALGVQLRYNEFDEKIMVTWEGKTVALEDPIRNHIWMTIDRRFHFQVPQEFFDMMLGEIAHEHPYHPVCDYLASLRWDGVKRIDKWLTSYGGVKESPYSTAVGRMFLIAAVRRARHPGCKYDELLTLNSGQGFNKSTAIRKLCPDENWFSDDLPLNADSKEMIERTVGRWILEVSELQGLRKRENDQLKSQLSRQVDGPVRMAYARMSISRPRHFVLVGTTNVRYFLKDKTGERRFWPVETGRFDVDAIVSDRDQLWAEAAVAEAAGESIRLDPSLWAVAGEHQEAHSVEDEWLVLLRKQFTGTDGKLNDRIPLELPWQSLGIDPKDRDGGRSERLAACMQALGYQRKQSRGLLEVDQRSMKRWCLRDNS